MIFEQSWRWYGPKDPVDLEMIKQAGAHGVVTALHHIPVGEVWSVAEIEKRITTLEESNKKHPFRLHWNVVESLPVHEAIKLGKPERDEFIENYKISLRNLGRCGVNIICYNFMPVLDWLRTNVKFQLEDGSTALLHDKVELAVFDLFILKRENAERDYSDDIIKEAKKRFQNKSSQDLAILEQSMLMALPGDDEGFTLEKLKKSLATFDGISAERLREHLVHFLKEVIPVAEQSGVKMAIHPDDPPWSVFGLPRIVSDVEDLDYLFNTVPSTANGLTFCSGSLGASALNNLPEIISKFYERIHFVHLRSVQREKSDYFYEANHLEGSVGMFDLVKTFFDLQQKIGREPIPMRPDHGHEMMYDKEKQFYPGYSVIGRMRGLAELRGLETGIINSYK
ncbi:mannonate dehydratase [Salegentibacter sp. 24]|uniref:mannonate dehydratase n=1 Tax=Salegentibacter sp. 24 TaxID=2183986 RepID=UPI00105F916C|nr:mannonate dehydratase [Salegentibacter sp. 24]TDN95451.1 mannonate dehydratase [Salegentibacter sp. 24]